MSKAVVIRYETRPESAEANQRLVERVFAELADANPGGLRYASFRLADGLTFMHIVIAEGDSNPLPGLPAFKEFQSGLASRVTGPPERGEATVVGSYRFGDTG